MTRTRVTRMTSLTLVTSLSWMTRVTDYLGD